MTENIDFGNFVIKRYQDQRQANQDFKALELLSSLPSTNHNVRTVGFEMGTRVSDLILENVYGIPLSEVFTKKSKLTAVEKRAILTRYKSYILELQSLILTRATMTTSIFPHGALKYDNIAVLVMTADDPSVGISITLSPSNLIYDYVKDEIVIVDPN